MSTETKTPKTFVGVGYLDNIKGNYIKNWDDEVVVPKWHQEKGFFSAAESGYTACLPFPIAGTERPEWVTPGESLYFNVMWQRSPKHAERSATFYFVSDGNGGWVRTTPAKDRKLKAALTSMGSDCFYDPPSCCEVR